LPTAQTAPSAAFFTVIFGKGTMNKSGSYFQLRSEFCKLRMLFFSVVRGAMNIPRR
jgi:hypothetical protein